MSNRDVAKAVEVREETVSRWINHNDDFIAEYSRRSARINAVVDMRIIAGCNKHIQTLDLIASDDKQPASARVQAIALMMSNRPPPVRPSDEDPLDVPSVMGPTKTEVA